MPKIDNDALGIVQFLATVYDKELTPGALRGYVNLLSDLPEETLRKASNEWTRKQKWFPKVSELRQLALQFTQTLKAGDAIIERLNSLYDQALDGHFEAEVWMKLIINLRVSDREAMADAWRRRYDYLCGDLTIDPNTLDDDWKKPRYAEVVP